MASQKTKSRSSNQNRRRGGARKASEKTEKYRFAKNVGGEGTVAEREYRRYVESDAGDPPDPPDVLIDVPVVKVDSIHFELDDLDAHVALRAHALNHLVKLHVGVDVHLGKVRVDIKGVEAQALVRVRLDHVTAIVDRVLTTLDRNPAILQSIGEAVEDIGAGAWKTLDETGKAVGHVGKGAGQAVGNLDQTLGGLGETAGQAVGGLGEGVGQAGQAVGQAVGGLGEGVGQAGQGVGQAV